MAGPDKTGAKQGGPPVETRFKPGESGNPDGRPKGSRNKLGEAFTSALYADFTKANEDGVEQGAAVIADLRTKDPGAYVRVVASILPKELVVKDELSEVTDEELAALVAAARKALSDREDGGADAPAPRRTKQAKGVQTLQ